MSQQPRGPAGRSALLLGALLCLVLAKPVAADDVKVAVAANFTEAAREIGALFETSSGHRVLYSFGSTGQLYAQISLGAPFEVFLAADRARPEKAMAEGFAVTGSRFTYATGRIVLFSRDETLVRGEATLRTGSFSRLAIASPQTAPYGAAAVEAMQALGVYQALKAKLVQGTSIAQAYQFVETGNAELGFVALAQIARHGHGSRWIVPESLHAEIAQDAVLLQPGAGSTAAAAFLTFLQGPEAQAVKTAYGYGPGSR